MEEMWTFSEDRNAVINVIAIMNMPFLKHLCSALKYLIGKTDSAMCVVLVKKKNLIQYSCMNGKSQKIMYFKSVGQYNTVQAALAIIHVNINAG